MAYDEKLVSRVRSELGQQKGIAEKKMFGGLTFMVNGKMCLGVLNDDLMARIDPEVYKASLRKKGCREMRFTGRSMKGFIFITPEGTGNKKNLNYWIDLALDFNKRAKRSKKKK